ncbi:AAA ATPase domain-containing protein [Tieghemostelium lacteum]|uniref:AAA ATPase domain-containing protein n=1 Tax=Tieghemostelium lacteum TaxID=361077 RepID=A0A152A0Z2_TIELA|nr:AAA ATPase domain-containing protein [Tieghemostelium lacteum]|eukprot:KYQ99868.1 AAA ATPase domain-containing protein [Tieghemostelium lacteum]
MENNNNRSSYIQYILGVFFIQHIRTILYHTLYRRFGGMVKNRFYYIAKIASSDAMYLQLVEWLSATQHLYTNSRQVHVHSKQNVEMPLSSEPHQVISIGPTINQNEDGNSSIKMIPSGTSVFFYKRHMVSVTLRSNIRSSMDEPSSDTLELRVYLGGKQLINDILKTAFQHHLSKTEENTKIYQTLPNCNIWVVQSLQRRREIDSVFLDKSVKDELIGDVNTFIRSKQWYRSSGVPYTRGYLLYGPPGTGKTSFILSLAGYFNKQICIMNLGRGVSDTSLYFMINKTPPNSILVFEDVDSAFTNTGNHNHIGQDDMGNKLTLQGLLHALDTLPNLDGRILVMTTNHIEKIPQALLSPGRVHLKVKFDLANHFQIKQMFKRFYENKYNHLLPALLKKIENNTVSTAQLQNLFINYRDDPTKITDSVLDEFISDSVLVNTHKTKYL